MHTTTLAMIADATQGRAVGDASRTISGVCAPEDAHPERICVVWDKKALERIPPGIPILAESGMLDGRDGVEHPSPRAALVSLLPLFDRRLPPPAGVHPSAVVSPSADVSPEAVVGPCCVVADGASVGARSVLQANVFLGQGAVVGEDCRLEAGACVEDFVQIGDRVQIHSGVAIGGDGFGFIPMADGSWQKIPQIGTVIIEDDVEIGANSTIDRATFGTTRIGRGTKLGSLVHVAHNCVIGEHCAIVGFVGLGGSTTIGTRSILAGQSGVADHVRIGSHVTVAGRTGVTKDIPDGMTVSGYPAQEHRQEGRFQASLRRVPDLMQRLKKIEERIGEKKDL